MEYELLQGKHTVHVPSFDIKTAIGVPFDEQHFKMIAFVYSTDYQSYDVVSEEHANDVIAETLRWLYAKGHRIIKFGKNQQAETHIMATRIQHGKKDIANILFFNGSKGMHVDLQIS